MLPSAASAGSGRSRATRSRMSSCSRCSSDGAASLPVASALRRKRPSKSASVSWLSRRMFSRPGRPQRRSASISASPASPNGSSSTVSIGWRLSRRVGNRRFVSRLVRTRRLLRGVEILPELAARVERVDAHVEVAAEQREHAVIALGDVGDAEHVQRAAQPRRLEPPLGLDQQLAERQERRAGAGTLLGEQPARCEDLQPQRALPAFGRSEARPLVERATGSVIDRIWCDRASACACRAVRAPLGEHARPRARVLVEEPRQRRRQLAAPAVDGVGAVAGSAEVGAHRPELRIGDASRVVKQREQAALDVVGVDRARRRQRALGDARQEPAQERDLEVGGDPGALGQPQLHVGLDVGVGHHHAHRLERARGATLLADRVGERAQQLLGGVRIDETDHRRSPSVPGLS